MAISKIYKIELIGLYEDKEIILATLQRLGLVELIQLKESFKEAATLLPRSSQDTSQILAIEEAITFLGNFKEKPGILESVVKLKPLIYKDELEKFIQSFNYSEVIQQLTRLRNELRHLSQQKEKILQERLHLAPWRRLRIPLEQLRPTDSVSICLGAVVKSEYPQILETCEREKIDAFFEEVQQDAHHSYLVIIYIKEQFERLEKILKNFHFNFIVLGRYPLTVKERLFEINTQSMILDDEIKEKKDAIKELAQQQFKLMVVYDYLYNIKLRQEAQVNLLRQQYTFLLQGWIREKDVTQLKEALAKECKDAALFLSEPSAQDDIPTSLENRQIIQPFEAVTNLYGQPIYTGIDPSAFLAPFFAFSFAFCLLDAGYGMLLMALTIILLRKKQITNHGRKLVKLFLLMSIATIFAGIVTGGFFADVLTRMPPQLGLLQRLQRRFILFDPIKDSLIFLGLTLVIGFLQVWFGVLIKFIRDLRNDKFTAFLFDLPTLLVQLTLLCIVLGYANIIPALVIRYVAILFAMSALSVIYYQWKVNKEMSLKIFWSVFGLYSIITGNFLADTLSFSRIFALGLTGTLLGMAINTMLFPSGPHTSIISVIGAAIALMFLFFGHLLNLAVSVLGAYVHTSRLQYLEFFSKFFEAGGRPFRPFKEETKYIFLAKR